MADMQVKKVKWQIAILGLPTPLDLVLFPYVFLRCAVRAMDISNIVYLLW